MSTIPKILIIDGLNMFIRCFVVVPTMDTNGDPIGGIVGFLKSMKAQIREVQPDRVVVAWDGDGGSQRRRGVYSDYKEGRKVRLNRELGTEGAQIEQENMRSQLKRLKQFLELVGTVQIEVEDIEADDVIAFLCKFVFADNEKVVVTSDRDMLQLVDNRTLVYSPTKKMYWTRAEMMEKMNVMPENYIFVKALMGDCSDNIKGMGGIGEKTALKLFPFLSEHESNLEEIRTHAEANVANGPKYKSILDQWDRLLENVQLMQLSHPIISSQSARTVRISATEQKPRFNFTELKLNFARHGIQVVDQDMFSVLKAYQLRAEAS